MVDSGLKPLGVTMLDQIDAGCGALSALAVHECTENAYTHGQEAAVVCPVCIAPTAEGMAAALKCT